MNPEFLLNGSCRFMYKTWMEGTYNKKLHFFVIHVYILNQMGWGFCRVL